MLQKSFAGNCNEHIYIIQSDPVAQWSLQLKKNTRHARRCFPTCNLMSFDTNLMPFHIDHCKICLCLYEPFIQWLTAYYFTCLNILLIKYWFILAPIPDSIFSSELLPQLEETNNACKIRIYSQFILLYPR